MGAHTRPRGKPPRRRRARVPATPSGPLLVVPHRLSLAEALYASELVRSACAGFGGEVVLAIRPSSAYAMGNLFRGVPNLRFVTWDPAQARSRAVLAASRGAIVRFLPGSRRGRCPFAELGMTRVPPRPARSPAGEAALAERLAPEKPYAVVAGDARPADVGPGLGVVVVSPLTPNPFDWMGVIDGAEELHAPPGSFFMQAAAALGLRPRRVALLP